MTGSASAGPRQRGKRRSRRRRRAARPATTAARPLARAPGPPCARHQYSPALAGLRTSCPLTKCARCALTKEGRQEGPPRFVSDSPLAEGWSGWMFSSRRGLVMRSVARWSDFTRLNLLQTSAATGDVLTLVGLYGSLVVGFGVYES